MSVAAAALDLLFPPTCGACRAPLPALVLLCDDCACAAVRLGTDCCPRCSSPLQEASCPDCEARVEQLAAAGFDRARALYVYGGPIEDALLRTKFGDAPHLAQAAGKALARELVKGRLLARASSVDLVVPIPVGRARLRERGYDQALLMARPVARALKRPLAPLLLTRTRETPPQARLGRAARARNVAGAFAVAPRYAHGPGLRERVVLLVDDVLTTGATADAAAAALKSAGAKRVEVLTLARALL